MTPDENASHSTRLYDALLELAIEATSSRGDDVQIAATDFVGSVVIVAEGNTGPRRFVAIWVGYVEAMVKGEAEGRSIEDYTRSVWLTADAAPLVMGALQRVFPDQGVPRQS